MLTISNLSKRFNRKAPPALKGVSFEVEKQQIYGLLGHNGAGKSTALGIMLGMVHADSGEVIIGGESVQKNRQGALRKVGAIFESPSFYEYLTGGQNLKVLTSFSGGVSESEISEMAEWVGLDGRMNHKVGTYSHGMRQRLGLAQAMLPKPEVLILDEPTDGLDPEGIVEFRDQLFQLRDEFGVTILLSSHLLSEVEQVCDRVVILQKGERVYEGSGKELGDENYVFKVATEAWDQVGKVLESFEGVCLEDSLVRFPESKDPAEVLAALVGSGIRVSEFVRVEETLEKLYLGFSSIATKGDKI